MIYTMIWNTNLVYIQSCNFRSVGLQRGGGKGYAYLHNRIIVATWHAPDIFRQQQNYRGTFNLIWFHQLLHRVHLTKLDTTTTWTWNICIRWNLGLYQPQILLLSWHSRFYNEIGFLLGVQTEMIGNNETYKKKCYSLSLHLLDFSPLCLFINSQPFLATTLDPKYVAILFLSQNTVFALFSS